MKENNRILSLLICIVMIVGMMSAFCLPAMAYENAENFVIGQQHDFEFENVDDEIRFKFVPETSGFYRFWSECDGTDPVMSIYVYDSENSQYKDIASADDNAYNRNFELVVSLDAGTEYYLAFGIYQDEYYTGTAFSLFSCKVPDPTDIAIEGPDKVYRFIEYFYDIVPVPSESRFKESFFSSDNNEVVSITSWGDAMFFNVGTVAFKANAETSKGMLTKDLTVTVFEPDLVDLSVKTTLPEIYNEEIYGNIVKFTCPEDGYYRITCKADDYAYLRITDSENYYIGSYGFEDGNEYFDTYLCKDDTYYLYYSSYDDIEVQFVKAPLPEGVSFDQGDSIVAYEGTEGYVNYEMKPNTATEVPFYLEDVESDVVKINDQNGWEADLIFASPGEITLNATSPECDATGSLNVKVIPAEVITTGQEYTFDYTKTYNNNSVISFTPEEDGAYTFKFEVDGVFLANIFGFEYGNYYEVYKNEKNTFHLNAGNTYCVKSFGEGEYTVQVEKTVEATGIKFDQGNEIYVGLMDEFDITATTTPFNSYDVPLDITLDTEDYISRVAETVYASGGDLVTSGGNLVIYSGYRAYAAGVTKATATPTDENSTLTPAEATVTVVDAEEIALGETKTRNFDEKYLSYTYKFTVDEDGEYCISQTGDNEILLNGFSYAYGSPYTTVYMQKDYEYYITVKNTDGKAWTSSITIDKCENIKSISIHKDYPLFPYNLDIFPSLTEIIIEEGHPDYISQDGIIYTTDMKGVVYVARGLSGKVTLAQTVKVIGDSAFAGRENVTEVVMPDEVTKLYDWSFYNSGIEKVKIPLSVTRITYRSFSNCENLKAVSIPKSVKKIDSFAFDGSEAITDVYYEGTAEEFAGIKVRSGNGSLLAEGVNFHFNVDLCDHVYDNACDATCNKCEKAREIAHVYDNACDISCNLCGAPREITHTYDNTCDTNCNVCNAAREITHTFGAYLSDKNATTSADGTKTRTCSVCGVKETITNEGSKLTDTTAVFADVKAKKWYTNAINYSYSHGFIAGVSKTEFGRDQDVTRGMFITILARIAGVDTSKNANKVETKFTDVKSGKYYTAAIKWASENGIVNGLTETTFGPEASIERQQLCTMIVNFAKYMNIQLTETKAEIAFADAKSIRKYARNAVSACQKADIVSGYAVNGGTEFKPLETASRAEAAQILYKFHKDFVVE